MRALLYLLSMSGVVALAYWAYHQGYETRHTGREVDKLQRELGQLHEELSVLRAEWAYLNRPDRLRVLAEMNFETLGLMPLTPEQFGTVTQIDWPPIAVPDLEPEFRPELDPDGAFDLTQELSEATITEVENLSGELPQAAEPTQADSPRMIQPSPHTPQPELVP